MILAFLLCWLMPHWPTAEAIRDRVSRCESRVTVMGCPVSDIVVVARLPETDGVDRWMAAMSQRMAPRARVMLAERCSRIMRRGVDPVLRQRVIQRCYQVLDERRAERLLLSLGASDNWYMRSAAIDAMKRGYDGAIWRRHWRRVLLAETDPRVQVDAINGSTQILGDVTFRDELTTMLVNQRDHHEWRASIVSSLLITDVPNMSIRHISESVRRHCIDDDSREAARRVIEYFDGPSER